MLPSVKNNKMKIKKQFIALKFFVGICCTMVEKDRKMYPKYYLFSSDVLLRLCIGFIGFTFNAQLTKTHFSMLI